MTALQASPDFRFATPKPSYRCMGRARRCWQRLGRWGISLSLLSLALGCGVGRTPLDPPDRNPQHDAAGATRIPVRQDSGVDRAPMADGASSPRETGGVATADASEVRADGPVGADGRAGSPDTDGREAADVAAEGRASAPDSGDTKIADAAGELRASAPDGGDAKAADAAGESRASAPDTNVVVVVDAGAKDSDAAASRADSGGDAPASGLFLTVVFIGGGSGTVTSSPPGIQCSPNCSATFAASPVVLSARTSNGSDSRFAGWGGACSGLTRDCTVVLSASTTVTAQFEPIDHNLIFLSSVHTYTPDLGSAIAYDGQCNQLATAAGINNAAGNAYMAWVSDSHSSALSRLVPARGFMRMDGEPVADDPAAMLADFQFFNPINIDETGTTLLAATGVLTGMDFYGNGTQADCDDWTATSGSATGLVGCTPCGPPTWYYWENAPCGQLVGSLYCFMKTKTSALTITPQLGRKVFLTNGPVAIGQSADAQCESAKPSGTGPVAALRATTTVAASTMIDPTATYVRPDGIVVGLGADVISSTLKSGIWQQGNGLYQENRAVWTGSSTPADLGTTANTCSDWTKNTGAMFAGSSSSVALAWWVDNIPWTCASTYTWSYCIEK